MRKYNVYRRKDGRWEGRIARGRRKNGKRSYKYIFAKSREDVIRQIDSIYIISMKFGRIIIWWKNIVWILLMDLINIL